MLKRLCYTAIFLLNVNFGAATASIPSPIAANTWVGHEVISGLKFETGWQKGELVLNHGSNTVIPLTVQATIHANNGQSQTIILVNKSLGYNLVLRYYFSIDTFEIIWLDKAGVEILPDNKLLTKQINH